MGIYKKIFQKITGREKKPKKRKSMKTVNFKRRASERLQKDKETGTKKQRKPIFKKLTPEQKKKALEAFKKVSGTIVKYSGGKPQVKVKAAPQPKKTAQPKTEQQPGVNFWNNKIDMGFIQPTGTQLVVGGTAALLVGGLAYKSLRK